MATLFVTEPAVKYARVAVERGVDRYPDGLTYAVGQALVDLAPGDRVVVPLGRADTPTPGYVIEISDTTDVDPQRIKPVERRDETTPRLPAQLLELARWLSSYYCTPIGMTLATMVPAAVKRRVGLVTRTLVELAAPPTPDLKLPAKQREVLEVLMRLPADRRPIEIRALAALAGAKTTTPLKALIKRRLLRPVHRTTVEAAWAEHATEVAPPPVPTEPQQGVIEAIAKRLDQGFSAHVLFGVTGSGKTEVYFRLIEQVLAAGKVAVLLVPEISLTPQTGGRLIGRFPKARVAILHSGLTPAQRHQQWALAASGAANIVLGARSAVFAPVPDGRLGLLIADEEHDSSYKQDQAPRYQGRDVAIRRAQIARCPVLLGSATPSLESWYNATARSGWTLHRLAHRAPGLRLPQVRIVDFREQQQARTDRRVHLIGPVLEEAIGRTLGHGGQVLLLLNRRGYANYIACPDHRCGWLMKCDHCDITMVYHLGLKLRSGGYAQCHHCGAEQRLPSTCPDCGNRVTTFGLGTQRVEEELARKFPQLVEGRTMLRMDSDTMRGARDLHRALDAFGAGSVRLLVGTQMIAKGLDYPGVRLVGVINADTAIHLPDFRASERTFQLVSQVAGRCGRGSHPGWVIVQTFCPSAPAIRLAAAHDYETFARQELAERERFGLPPVSRMARIVIRDADSARCRATAQHLAGELRRLAEPGVRIRGAAPCPITRIAGRHRQQIELLAGTAASLQRLLTTARRRALIRPGTAMAIDVDPIDLV